MGCGPSQPQEPVGGTDTTPQKDAGVESKSKKLVLPSVTPDIATVYTLDKVLGRGQFGVTRLAIDKKTGEKFACKTISKRKLVSEEDIEDVRREVQIMKHLRGNPNIVTLVNTFEDRYNVHLVMELASGGELFDRIVDRGHYSEKAAADLIRTMVSVVAHCHNMNVFHRDLKPENFLLDSPSEDAVLKATDFGLSVFFKDGEVFTDVVGSAYYVAPEVLARKYNQSADIWSCGVILYILLSGVPPFWGENEQLIFRSIINDELDFKSDPWPKISQEAKDCVQCMLERDPQKRATANQILQHEWMKENGIASDKPLDVAVVTRIKGFAAMNKLKKEALRIIALNLPAEEIAGLKAMFQSIDTDKSGTITVQELKEALKLKGANLPDEELQNIMANADVDGDGVIEYEEFLASTMHINKLEDDEAMFQAFQHFDTDKNGKISLDELKVALAQRHKDLDIEAILNEVDKDGNGNIDYEEFCEMMRQDNSSAPFKKTSIYY
eukprot:TRINITY_DN2296_c0_g1_i1.p2 TRINITY_DN2296_c0_g1~~TRINITY_DN2296_c0_g1_i1.p2  ORF type:complete len:497 (-),score=108.07 TRINITY_DN2296_c0_g1_i1:352-1842(-)